MTRIISMAVSLLFHFHGYHLRGLLVSHFLLIWSFLLVFTVVAGLLANRQHPLFPETSREKLTRESLKRKWGLPFQDAIALIIFALFTAFYIALIFYKEDFAYYDNDQLTDFSVQGKPYPPPIWWALGRYFPLGFQEFNALAWVTRSPTGFHFFSVMQLLIVLLAINTLLKEYAAGYRVLVLIAVMVTPGFAISFTGLIYTERNVLFWLALLILCLSSYFKTRASVYFIGCLVATHFVLYYKETAIILVVGYVVVQLLWESYSHWRTGVSWTEFARRNSLPFGMLVLSGIYAALFLLTMFPRGALPYVSGLQQSLRAVVVTYLQTDWLLFLLIGLFGFHFLRFVFSNRELDPLWESLAAGALAYAFTILALGLVSGYYMAPVDLIAILYAARILLAWLVKPTKLRIAVAIATFACILVHDVAYSTFRITERKSLIALKAELADFLNNYPGDPDGIHLFLPYASQFRAMGLSSYLRYRGFEMTGYNLAGNGTGRRIFVEGGNAFPHNRCIEYRDYVCVHADRPRDGALIVVLPDDVVSTDDVATIGKDSRLLMSANPCPFCTKENSWFRMLHAISPEFYNIKLPGHYLQLHVFQQGATAPPRVDLRSNQTSGHSQSNLIYGGAAVLLWQNIR